MEASKSKPSLASHQSTGQTLTIRNLPWTYLHLSLISSSTLMSTSSALSVDMLTARTYLTSALQQYRGLTGTAISIDFLNVDGRDVWIRVPREDGAVVVGAVSAWMGAEGVAWRLKGKGEWLGALAAGDGRELFEA